MDGQFLEGTEVCDGFGLVKTYVQLMGEAVDRSRDALCAMPPKALASRALGYVIWDFVRQPRALLEQMRHPVARVGWWRRAARSSSTCSWFPGGCSHGEQNGCERLDGIKRSPNCVFSPGHSALSRWLRSSPGVPA
jgi:hypothetical protein